MIQKFYSYLYHNSLAALTLFWVIASAISALPKPDVNSSVLYRWFYNFSNVIGASLDKVIADLTHKGGINIASKTENT